MSIAKWVVAVDPGMGHVDPQISRTEYAFGIRPSEYANSTALDRVKVDLGKVFEKGQGKLSGSIVRAKLTHSLCGTITSNIARRSSSLRFRRWQGQLFHAVVNGKLMTIGSSS
jgi:hypothetical protein